MQRTVVQLHSNYQACSGIIDLAARKVMVLHTFGPGRYAFACHASLCPCLDENYTAHSLQR